MPGQRHEYGCAGAYGLAYLSSITWAWAVTVRAGTRAHRNITPTNTNIAFLTFTMFSSLFGPSGTNVFTSLKPYGRREGYPFPSIS